MHHVITFFRKQRLLFSSNEYYSAFMYFFVCVLVSYPSIVSVYLNPIHGSDEGKQLLAVNNIINNGGYSCSVSQVDLSKPQLLYHIKDWPPAYSYVIYIFNLLFSMYYSVVLFKYLLLFLGYLGWIFLFQKLLKSNLSRFLMVIVLPTLVNLNPTDLLITSLFPYTLLLLNKYRLSSHTTLISPLLLLISAITGVMVAFKFSANYIPMAFAIFVVWKEGWHTFRAWWDSFLISCLAAGTFFTIYYYDKLHANGISAMDKITIKLEWPMLYEPVAAIIMPIFRPSRWLMVRIVSSFANLPHTIVYWSTFVVCLVLIIYLSFKVLKSNNSTSYFGEIFVLFSVINASMLNLLGILYFASLSGGWPGAGEPRYYNALYPMLWLLIISYFTNVKINYLRIILITISIVLISVSLFQFWNSNPVEQRSGIPGSRNDCLGYAFNEWEKAYPDYNRFKHRYYGYSWDFGLVDSVEHMPNLKFWNKVMASDSTVCVLLQREGDFRYRIEEIAKKLKFDKYSSNTWIIYHKIITPDTGREYLEKDQ